MWRGTVVLISVLAVSSAFQAIAQLEPKPDKFKNQEGCYMLEFDKVVPFGKTVPSIKSCVEYHCGEGHVTISGCSAIGHDPAQELIEEKGKPFPGCCPKPKN